MFVLSKLLGSATRTLLLFVLLCAGATAHADDRASAREVVEHFQNGLLYTLLHRHEQDYQTRIASLEALKAAIAADIATAREYWQSHPLMKSPT